MIPKTGPISIASDRNLPKKLAFYLAKAGLENQLDKCAAHKRMAPEMAFGRHRGPTPRNAHRASVLICLTPHPSPTSADPSRVEWMLPVTVRAKGLQDHGGQIALPGGRLDRGENAWNAAEREYGEELFRGEGATKPSQNSLKNTFSRNPKLLRVGQLSPIYVYASNNHVDVFVSFELTLPQYHPSETEVSEVVSIPLSYLLNEEAVIVGTMGRGTTTFEAPGYRFGDHFIWGATAMILAEFAEVVQDIP